MFMKKRFEKKLKEFKEISDFTHEVIKRLSQPYLEEKNELETKVSDAFDRLLNKIDLKGYLILDHKTSYLKKENKFVIEILEIQNLIGGKRKYEKNFTEGREYFIKNLLEEKLGFGEEHSSKWGNKKIFNFYKKYSVKGVFPFGEINYEK